MSYYYCGAIYVNLKHTNIAYMTRGGGGGLGRACVQQRISIRTSYTPSAVISYLVICRGGGGSKTHGLCSGGAWWDGGRGDASRVCGRRVPTYLRRRCSPRRRGHAKRDRNLGNREDHEPVVPPMNQTRTHIGAISVTVQKQRHRRRWRWCRGSGYIIIIIKLLLYRVIRRARAHTIFFHTDDSVLGFSAGAFEL